MIDRLCKNCIHCKSKRVGCISYVSWCGISKKGKDGGRLGVNPWLDKPHPKCPLRKKCKDNR